MKKSKYWRNLLGFSVGMLALGVFYIILRISFDGAQNYAHPARSQQAPEDNPAQHGVAYQNIELFTSDGIWLSAWYTSPENGALILVAHGYGVSRSAEIHALFARNGYGVLSWDARAHGESGGDLCTWGVDEVQDVVAALAFALKQTEVEHVGAYGQSMGAVVLILAAAEFPQIEALIADSAFPAIEEMLERLVYVPVLRPFVRFFAQLETGLAADELRPLDVVGTISPRPVLFIQGEADATIPADSVVRLYMASGEPRALWTEPGVGHVGMYDAFPYEFERRVIAFFDQYLLGRK
ncbi:MAG: alpha/beta hydrolase [Chloroflexi bacterium]|nr:alpha/beta hydrolase [Chloroflexota bacterium]